MRRLDDLKKRSFVSALAIILVFFIIYFSNNIYIKPLVVIVIGALAYFALKEYLDFALRKNVTLPKTVLSAAVIFEVIAFFIFSQFFVFAMMPLIVFFLFVVVLFISNFNKIENSFNKIAFSVFGFVYIAIPIAMILPILYLNSFQAQDGRMWLFYLIFITKITDIGAYFGGKLFGKKKLIEKVSPKKTVFGSVSGFIVAIIASYGFTYFSKPNFFDISIAEALVLGAILSIGSQIGDLSESLLKRDVGIKNSSNIPGIGGILDMMDSLILNIPITYFFLMG